LAHTIPPARVRVRTRAPRASWPTGHRLGAPRARRRLAAAPRGRRCLASGPRHGRLPEMGRASSHFARAFARPRLPAPSLALAASAAAARTLAATLAVAGVLGLARARSSLACARSSSATTRATRPFVFPPLPSSVRRPIRPFSSAPPWAGLRKLAPPRLRLPAPSFFLLAHAPGPLDLESRVPALNRSNARASATAQCSSELFSAAVLPCTRPGTSSALRAHRAAGLGPPRARTRVALLVGANRHRRRPPCLRAHRRSAGHGLGLARGEDEGPGPRGSAWPRQWPAGPAHAPGFRPFFFLFVLQEMFQMKFEFLQGQMRSKFVENYFVRFLLSRSVFEKYEMNFW
jgi:hypothetical protein